MRHVRYVRVSWKQARRGSVGIARVSGQKKMLREIQQAEMSPIAGVKFLAVQQEVGCCRSRVRLGAEVCNVRNALLFVHHQIFDDLQVLRCRLRHQMLRCVAVRACIIHVHVHIAADPLRACLFGRSSGLR